MTMAEAETSLELGDTDASLSAFLKARKLSSEKGLLHDQGSSYLGEADVRF
jgi:hypothetical protein